MKTEDRKPSAPCANPGCANRAFGDDEFCESCELERMLYRRDLRVPASGTRS